MIATQPSALIEICVFCVLTASFFYQRQILKGILLMFFLGCAFPKGELLQSVRAFKLSRIQQTLLAEQQFASVYMPILCKREIWVWLEVAWSAQIISHYIVDTCRYKNVRHFFSISAFQKWDISGGIDRHTEASQRHLDANVTCSGSCCIRLYL